MEIQIQNLLEQIKKDGIEKAKIESESILSQAHTEAQGIIRSAETQAKQIVESAQVEAKRFEDSTKAAIGQAGRDLVISVQNSLQSSFNNIIQKTIEEQFIGEQFVDCLAQVIRSFGGAVSLEVAPSVSEGLGAQLRAVLGKELAEGLEIRVNDRLGAGFILKERDGSAYYDFSAESIAEYIQEILSDQIADLITVQ